MRAHLFPTLILVGLAACGGDAPPAETASDGPSEPREVRFIASDFALQGPTSIEAGTITFVLDNVGEELHHLQLVRIDGMSMQDVQARLAEIRPGTPLPPWFVEVGGVNPPEPGIPARVTMTVEAGEYAVLCIVDTPDHIPHVMKGMIAPLTVTPSASAPAPLPAADLELVLADYALGFSAPPTRGSHVIRVTNTATQSHEVALFRLLPGKTMDDFMAWGATYAGPEPMVGVGGVPAFRPGMVAHMHVDLVPGEYIAACFVPDHVDGAPHLVHGMVSQFTVS
jgi:hypothetical protein